MRMLLQCCSAFPDQTAEPLRSGDVRLQHCDLFLHDGNLLLDALCFSDRPSRREPCSFDFSEIFLTSQIGLGAHRFCLWLKRLEEERFKWPVHLSPLASETARPPVVELDEDQFLWLLDGLDLKHLKPHRALEYRSVL